MKLRARAGLAAVAVMLPALATLAWAHLYALESAAQDALEPALLARALAESGRCEQAPETWSGLSAAAQGSPERSRVINERLALLRGGAASGAARPAVQFFAYDDGLVSRNPEAPALSEALKNAMRAGRATAKDAHVDGSGRRVVEILQRAPANSGACAFVLTRMTGAVVPSVVREQLLARVLLPATLIALIAVLLAVGPWVLRLRRLAREVVDSVHGDYQGAVTVQGTDEIGELASAFDKASATVRSQVARQEQREKRLRAFLENTTHDVMTPLTVLQGHLATFQRRTANGELPDAASLTDAMTEAHYMASLIHNLAVAARLEAGEPERQTEPVDLGALVERAVGRHAPIARQRAVKLDRALPRAPLWAIGDVTLIEQAVSNIIHNAVRYNRENGHVAVVLERVDPERFVVRVVDDGPGIPDHELSRLVERHFRGNAARSRDPDGRGLGLTIAFRVAQVHGFQLRLARAECGGLQVELEGNTIDAASRLQRDVRSV